MTVWPDLIMIPDRESIFSLLAYAFFTSFHDVQKGNIILLFRKVFSFLFAFSFGPKHTLIKMHELVRKSPLSDSMSFFLEHSLLPLKALTNTHTFWNSRLGARLRRARVWGRNRERRVENSDFLVTDAFLLSFPNCSLFIS